MTPGSAGTRIHNHCEAKKSHLSRGQEPYRDLAPLHKPQRLKVISPSGNSSDSGSSDAVPAGCALTVQAPRLIG
jgi:hypothetical protein